MKSHIPCRFLRKRNGAALVIVLAFVVLLTALVVAFFSRALNERGISNASASQTQAELFAQGALDSIVGAFQQEISAGSDPLKDPSGNVVKDANGNPVAYTPKVQANAVPALVGSTGANGLQNLVKISSGTSGFYPGTTLFLASAILTTDPSINGRSVTPARWNKPLLMPATSNIDLTPTLPWGTFTPPSWVLVARDGSNPTVWNTAMKWSGSGSTANSVIGRYAYAIYDEGGLLDMNVAGYPSNAATGTSAADLTRKGAVAFADLTQLPTTTGTLSQSDVDKIIAWRNAATATSGTAYVSSVLNNATGFLTVSSTNGLADRAFVSRQALIKFMTSGTLSLNTANVQSVLQYMGTFSRGLNQPSFAPDPNRPKIQSPGTRTGANWNESTYQGGNDACSGDDSVNPAFLSIRVQNTFQRGDYSQAIAGEPLVKKRFDLRRLAWLTYNGPSQGRSSADPDMQQVVANGITSAFLQQGTAANIQRNFGLAWNSGGWSYNTHLSPTGSICTLSQVAAQNREPDFFELLKAAICAGSLGKSSAAGNGGQDAGAYQHNLDISVDYQIIQIGANIIDQSDADGFPTWIRFNNSRDFYGTENMPGLYRTTFSWVLKRQPNPFIVSGTYQQVGSALLDGGEIALFLVPHVWNPHDQNDILVRGANYALGSPRPSSFRISVNSGIPGASSYNLATEAMYVCNLGAASTQSTSRSSFSALSGTLTFSDSGGALFREPTMLWKENYPQGSGLTSGSSIVSAIDSTQTYSGFYVGSRPAEIPSIVSGTNYILKACAIYNVRDSTTSSFEGFLGAMTYQSEYQEAGGSWKPYDVKCWDKQTDTPQSGGGECPVNLNSADPRTNGAFGWSLPPGFPSVSAYRFNSIVADPRTARWVGSHSEGMPQTIWDYPSGTNPNFSVVMTNRPGNAGNAGCETTHVGQTNPAGAFGSSGNLQNLMFYDTTYFSNGATNALVWGMLSQNNPYAPVDASGHKQFNADADGVVRRAMAAYVPVGTNLAATGTTGLPMAKATTFNASGVGAPSAAQSQSRPIILNRPFRTIDELGYVFKGTPWKNLDFFTPESGDTALLDAFCVGDGSDQNGLIAGSVNLNTRNKPVIQAILAGANFDELSTASALSSTEIQKIASALLARTAGASAWQGPLANIGDLVGRFVGKNIPGISISNPLTQAGNGSQGKNYYACNYESPGTAWGSSGNTVTFSGLSADLDSTVFDASHAAAAQYIQRLRQSAIRPLVSCGQTRVWNLMIDLVAQTGRYPQSATGLSNFLVEGEKRYWLHVAIDRATGRVIDRQLEAVNE